MTQIVELRVAMTCTCTHKGANIPLQGLDRRALTVGAISGPHGELEGSFGAFSPVKDLYGWQKHSGKADQSILASGGSEHA